jgi:hypothetical protein
MNRFVPEALRGGRRMRWTVSAVIALVLLLGVGGVAVAHFRSGSTPATSITLKPSTCANAYRLVSLRPSQITAANSVCLVQALKFTGELAGSVAQAYAVSADNAGPSSECAVPKRWDGYPQALLAMVIGSKAYRLRISPPSSSEHQAVTINNLANVVELAAISDPSTDWSQATGIVTLNPDGTTGTIDASLLRDVAGAQPVHVTGQWACGAPQALPALDASVPCANFYALNQLPDADVARMKASACNAENLTLSGDINAHLDHAITDTAIAPHPGVDGDNFCGTVGDNYTAAFKFTVGDESFELDLNANKYPAVDAGQYPTTSADGAVLWTGHADPSSQGQFVSDDQVFWAGRGGSFTIAPDMKSGTLDVSLAGPIDHAGSTVHITGNWRCAA